MLPRVDYPLPPGIHRRHALLNEDAGSPATAVPGALINLRCWMTTA